MDPVEYGEHLVDPSIRPRRDLSGAILAVEEERRVEQRDPGGLQEHREVEADVLVGIHPVFELQGMLLEERAPVELRPRDRLQQHDAMVAVQLERRGSEGGVQRLPDVPVEERREGLRVVVEDRRVRDHDVCIVLLGPLVQQLAHPHVGPVVAVGEAEIPASRDLHPDVPNGRQSLVSLTRHDADQIRIP